MTKYAVCFHQTEMSFALWVVVAAESARDAVEQVRHELDFSKHMNPPEGGEA